MKKNVLVCSIIFGTLISFHLHAQSWSSLIRLTWNSGNSYTPAIAIDSGSNIHVLWVDQTPGNPELIYKKKSGSSSNWSAPKRLTWSTGESSSPTIATHSAINIYIAWQDNSTGDYEIYFKKSSDGGTSWSAPQRLTWNAGWSQNPILVTESASIIHLFWEDYTPGNGEIYYKKSTDNGSTWSGPKRLTWTSGNSIHSAAVFDGLLNILHITWEDDTPGVSEINYKKSGTSGTTWSAPQRLTFNSGWSQNPAISIDNGSNIHIVWEDDTPGKFEIFYKQSTNSGQNWTPPNRMTWNTDESLVPSIARDGSNNLFVVWEDNSPGNFEIYFKESTDTGTSWTAPVRVTWNSNGSRNPIIATDTSGDIHVVWNDFTPGNYEIFYKNRK